MPTNLTTAGWLPVYIAAQATSGLPVTFGSDSAIASCQEFEPESWQVVQGTTVAGTANITAYQSGDSVWAPATPVFQPLVIQEPVNISGQPADATVSIGQQANFTVTATGTDLSYQWRKDGVAISGATSATYTIAAAVEADAGNYDCVVINPATSEISTAAILTVNPATGPRQILINFGNNDAGAGWNNITAAAFNTGSPIALTNELSQPSGASLLGFGNLDPSLNAYDPSIVSAQNTGSWNSGVEKDGMSPAAAADYFAFNSLPGADFFVAVTGLQPGKTYRLEVLAATEHIQLARQAHVLVRQFGAGAWAESPDRDANGTPNLANLGRHGEIDTQSQGWQAANWLIWDEVAPGLVGGDNLGLPGTRDDVFCLAFRDISSGNGSAAAINAIRITEALSSLSDWYAANGLTGADAAPEANPAGDGISNLLKYAFNMDPNTAYSGEARHLSPGSGQSGLPSITGIETPGGRKLRIEFLRRRNDASIIYQPRFSTDLQGWVPAIATPVVTPIDAEWERVVVEDLIDAWDRRFGQVMVEIAD
jgi:hypothetical protein